MILLQCAADARHGFWSAAWVKMGRPPRDPAAILAHFQAQDKGWMTRVGEIEPGLLLGRGVLTNCRLCSSHLLPVPAAISAEAERQHTELVNGC